MLEILHTLFKLSNYLILVFSLRVNSFKLFRKLLNEIFMIELIQIL